MRAKKANDGIVAKGMQVSLTGFYAITSLAAGSALTLSKYLKITRQLFHNIIWIPSARRLCAHK